jgi:hypothetical protein
MASTDRGVAVSVGAGVVTLIPRGVVDLELMVVGIDMRAACYLLPENARHLRDFITDWLDRFDAPSKAQ